jgi:methylated-DNA-[protein]-cysteine S-methyltransferase
MIRREHESDQLHRTLVETPLGRFALTASARGLRTLVPLGAGADSRDRDLRFAADTSAAPESRPHLASPGAAAVARDEPRHPQLAAATAALHAYCDGDPLPYSGALDLAGSEFQLRVWRRLLAIPFGAQATYGELAADLGLPGEARAVGAAVAANPVAILVPCHRVVGADGTLRGYAWGLDLKRRLLAHETGHAPALIQSPGAYGARRRGNPGSLAGG